MRDPLHPPPSVRHPDSIFLLALCVFAGIGQLVGPTSGTVQDLLPYWLTAAWGVLLVVGGLTTLAGAFWTNRTTGLLLEFAGRACFAPAALVYGAAVVAVVGPAGALAAAPFIGFAASSLWRMWHIHIAISDVRATLGIMRWARDHRDEP